MFRVRLGTLHGGCLRVRHCASLAARIQQLIPPGAFESEGSKPQNHPNQQPLTPQQITKLAAQLDLSAAASAVASLPLNTALITFSDLVAPTVKNGPLGSIGVLELLYKLHLEGNPMLVAQIAEQLELEQQVSGTSDLSASFSALERIANGDPPDYAVSTELGVRYPQILAQNTKSDVYEWLCARLLLAVEPQSNAGRDFQKYLQHFTPKQVALLARHHFQPQVLQQYLKTKKNSEEYAEIVDAQTTLKQYYLVTKNMVGKINETTPPAVAEAVLRSALKLKRTYDISTLCARHQFAPPLLASALLSLSFAQKRPPNESDVHNPVLGTAKTLQSVLVTRALANQKVKDAGEAVALAALRLQRAYPRKMPGKVFWQLVLSLPPGVLNAQGAHLPPAAVALARLASRRPLIEQLRYLALPAVPSAGVVALLRNHLRRIGQSRWLAASPADAKQADSDVLLIVLGLVIASEKGGHLSTVIRGVFDLNMDLCITQVAGSFIEAEAAAIAKTSAETSTGTPLETSKTATSADKPLEMSQTTVTSEGKPLEMSADTTATTNTCSTTTTPTTTSTSSTSSSTSSQTVTTSTSSTLSQTSSATSSATPLMPVHPRLLSAIQTQLLQQDQHQVVLQLLTALAPFAMNTLRASHSVERLLMSVITRHPHDSIRYVTEIANGPLRKLFPPWLATQAFVELSKQPVSGRELCRFFQIARTFQLRMNRDIQPEAAKALLEALAGMAAPWKRMQWALRVASETGVDIQAYTGDELTNAADD